MQHNRVWLKLRVLVLGALASAGAMAQELPQCEVVFTNAVSGNGAGSQLIMNNSSQITNLGGNNQLSFDTPSPYNTGSDGYWHDGRCDNAACELTGTALALELPAMPVDLPSINGQWVSRGQDITIPSSGQLNANEFSGLSTWGGANITFETDDYDTFSVGSLQPANNASVSFSQGTYYIDTFTLNGGNRAEFGGGTYYIDTFNVGNNSELLLRPGTYYINRLTIQQGSEVSVEGNGTVTIYTQRLETNSVQVNGLNGNANLEVYVTGGLSGYDLLVTGTSHLQGLFYVDGSTELNNTSEVTGALSSNELYMRNSSKVNYDGGAIQGASRCESQDQGDDDVQACEVSFPTVISTTASGQVRLSGSATDIYGTINGAVVTPTMVRNGNPNCDGGACSATGTAAAALDFPEWCASDEELKPKSDLVLEAGQSYCYGDLKLSGQRDIRVNGTGTATLYLTGDAQVTGPAELNTGGSPDQLRIVTQGDFSHTGNGDTHAFIYSQGQLELGGNVDYYGAFQSESEVWVHGNSTVRYFGDVAEQCGPGGSEDEVHHYRLLHDATAYTCGASTVTIRACADQACTSQVTDAVSMTLSASDGASFSPSSQTFNGNATVELTKSTAGETTLSVASATPSAPVLCESDSGGDCRVSFSDVGLNVSWGSAASVVNIPSQQAQSAWPETLYVSLGEAQSCQADIAGGQLQLAVQCVSPGSCNNNMFAIDGSTTGDTENYADAGVTFDENGIAEVPAGFLRYDDAGQIKLNVQVAGTQVSGSSNAFAVAPLLSLGLGTSATTGETDAFVAAEDLPLSVRAVGAQGAVTPNYQPGDLRLRLQQSMPQSNAVTAVFAPGNLSSQPTTDSGFSNYDDELIGTFTQGEASWIGSLNETGEYSLTLQDNNYYGVSINSNAVSWLSVPHHMTLEITAHTLNATSGFIYLQQTTELGQAAEVVLTARNKAGEVTANYSGELWQLTTPEIQQWAVTDEAYQQRAQLMPGGELSHNLGVSFSESAGVGNYTIDGSVTYQRPAASTLTNVPPGSNELTLSAPPEVFQLAYGDHLLCIRENADDNDCDGVLVTSGQLTELRHGRAVLQNAYGPAGEPLDVPLQIEYYNGSRWVVNRDDYVTDYDSDEVTVDDELGLESHSGIVEAGRAPSAHGFVIQAYANSHESQAEWDVPQYLEYDWDGDGSHDNDPQADVRFGLYRSNDRIINWREVQEDEQGETN
ncbi:hypothetical protein HMF8227_00286 [Saliniradius amylolyticus]|uniref:MSHA biogenesis protein MshQ n=1 Tax=Saliniradius amylolyticus TaxID=2183582 RepID=A0A2S2DZG8_9ALTE|nr:DUF6701 domain-containing protein [Saliniradius amylolyticus]AWL10794.1 hypothetical protein HMF8227_00286 [Saliniradius amylolyticus]